MKNPHFADHCKCHRIALLVIILAIMACNLNQTIDSTPNYPAPTSSENKYGADENPPQSSSPARSLSTQNPTPTSREAFRSTDEPTPQTTLELNPSPTPVQNIETLLSSCPSEIELDRFKADFYFLFAGSNPFPPYDCQNGTGPEGQVKPRLALYQGLRVIHALQFDQPLPWTELGLYDWLKGTIRGIMITDAEFSYCCASGKQIVLKADLLNQSDYQTWVNPQSGGGLIGLIGLIVHEARHAEVGAHTCESDDATLEELGAWGTQYYLFVYIAEHTPQTLFTQGQRQTALSYADTALSRICNP